MTLLQIPTCDIASLERDPPPRPMIQTDNDVHAWQRSESYAHLLLYIHRLGEAVVGTELRNSPIDTRIEEVGIKQYIVAQINNHPLASRFAQF